VTAASSCGRRNLLNHARLIGLREIHDGVGRLVREVHVIVAGEHRSLATGAMARAAAVVGLDVLPQVDAEGLHVGVGRSRTGVIEHRRRRGDGLTTVGAPPLEQPARIATAVAAENQ
jgi:hypothetical protein